MAQGLIPNELIRWHFATIATNGELVDWLLEKHQIPAEVFQQGGKLITADQYAAILNHTIVQGDDESFGCLKRPIRRGAFQLMIHACISCESVEQVIERCFEFYRLMNDQVQWHLDKDSEQARLIFSFKGINPVLHCYFIAFIASIIWRWLSWMADRQISLSKAEFNFPAPDCASEMTRVFQIEPEYGATVTQLSFDVDYLSLPIKQTSHSLARFLTHIPGILLSHYQEDLSLAKRLSDYLQQHPSINQATLTEAAEYFCCSEQSLIRGLRNEGTRFKQVADRIKRQRAEFLLVRSHLTNQQIAEKLGYSDPSVFYRSVKKWFDKTPSQLRVG